MRRMAKHRLIDQLRVDYQRKEEEIKAPIVKALRHEKREKELAQMAYKEIEFKLGQDIIKYVMDNAKHHIAQELYKVLPDIFKNLQDPNGFINITLPKQPFLFAGGDKQIEILIKEYILQCRPLLKITSDYNFELDVVYVQIPPLNLRIPVSK